MAHDYAYGTRYDSEGADTAFGSTATMVRILPEVYAAQRARPSVIASQHGSVVDSRRFYDSFNFILQVDASYGGPPDDPDTLMANIGTILKRMNSNIEKVWLTRTAPDQGAVEIPIIVLRSPQTANPRHRLRIPCRALDPFWRDQAETFDQDPLTDVAVSGSAPIGDAVLVFSGAAVAATLTHLQSGDTITITANTTVNAVTVDCGARTVKQLGAHVDGVMTASEPWLLELVPDFTNTFTLSSGAVNIVARDKWL